MRKGLRPLSVHMGMALSAWPYFSMEQSLIQGAVPDHIQKMLRGIHLYQNHPFKTVRGNLNIVWQAGNVTLSALPEYAYSSGQEALVLVPSLINKSDILDLMPERSMMRWLAAQGLNVYLLDWGDLSAGDQAQTMDDLIQERLVPALRALHDIEGQAVHALGYCMGGTILMGAAAQVQSCLKSLILLAAPWDFHAGSRALLNRIKFWAPSALPAIEEKGILTTDWVQMLFASLDPTTSIKKFSNFAAMDQNSEEAHLFIAVEDWLNDGVDIPKAIAQHCIKEWFFENNPALGQWHIAGKPICLDRFQCPVLVVASEKDRLVEFDTAQAIEQKIKHSTLLNPACGHIGMIAGRDAVDLVWKPIAKWVQECP